MGTLKIVGIGVAAAVVSDYGVVYLTKAVDLGETGNIAAKYAIAGVTALALFHLLKV